MNSTPLPPPQVVMAPAEALAVLTAEIERRSRYATGDKFCEPMLQARATFRALLARCEGLEAALRELMGQAELQNAAYGNPNSPSMQDALSNARAKLAATRTTGGDAGIASRAADDAARPHTTPED